MGWAGAISDVASARTLAVDRVSGQTTNGTSGPGNCNSERMAAGIQARWDAALLDRSTDFAAAVRSLRHLAESYGRPVDQDDQRRRLDQAQERLRVLSEELRLVGSRRVQVAARRVQHHAYAVRVEGKRDEIRVAGFIRMRSPLLG